MNRRIYYAEAVEREQRRHTLRRALYLLICWCLGVAFVLLLCVDGWN